MASFSDSNMRDNNTTQLLDSSSSQDIIGSTPISSPAPNTNASIYVTTQNSTELPNTSIEASVFFKAPDANINDSNPSTTTSNTNGDQSVTTSNTSFITTSANGMIITIDPSFPGITNDGLRFAPPELRRSIFQNVFSGYYHHFWRRSIQQVPSLFISLRKDAELYYEAFEVYTQQAVVCVNWNQTSSKHPREYLALPFESVRTIHVFFISPLIFKPLSGRLINCSPCASELFSKATNATKITLDFTDAPLRRFHWPKYHRHYQSAAKCFQNMSGLKGVKVLYRSIQTRWYWITGLGDHHPDFISFLDEGLGCEGVLRVTYKEGYWEWMVADGDVLEWTSRRHASNTMGWMLSEFWNGIEDMSAEIRGIEDMGVEIRGVEDMGVEDRDVENIYEV